MAYLTLDQTRAGMVLSADVLDRRGHRLIPRGNELTERHVSALRMWGVSHLEVVGDARAESGTPPVSPEILAAAEAETAELFVNAADEHPFLDALRALATERRATALAQGVRP